MTKELVNLINSISFTTTKTIKKVDENTTTTTSVSRIQMPKSEQPAPKPVLTEPIGFELVFEKNSNLKIAAVKRHENPNCCYITYKEFSDDGELLTGQFNKNGNVISEYKTIVFDWAETMRAFNPAFCATTNISCNHAPEMYIPKMLGAAMKAFRQNQDQFRHSIRIFNKTMTAFNSQVENIGIGITNIQSQLLKKLEDEKGKTEKLEKFLNMIQQMLTESDPEKYSGLIADIRGSLDVPIEERYIKATKHHRRTRKEAVDAANDNK